MRTGRFRFSKGAFGVQVLEVEVSYPDGPHCIGRTLEWIKGTTSDAADIEQALNGTVKKEKRGCALSTGSTT